MKVFKFWCCVRMPKILIYYVTVFHNFLKCIIFLNNRSNVMYINLVAVLSKVSCAIFLDDAPDFLLPGFFWLASNLKQLQPWASLAIVTSRYGWCDQNLPPSLVPLYFWPLKQPWILFKVRGGGGLDRGLL